MAVPQLTREIKPGATITPYTEAELSLRPDQSGPNAETVVVYNVVKDRGPDFRQVITKTLARFKTTRGIAQYMAYEEDKNNIARNPPPNYIPGFPVFTIETGNPEIAYGVLLFADQHYVNNVTPEQRQRWLQEWLALYNPEEKADMIAEIANDPFFEETPITNRADLDPEKYSEVRDKMVLILSNNIAQQLGLDPLLVLHAAISYGMALDEADEFSPIAEEIRPQYRELYNLVNPTKYPVEQETNIPPRGGSTLEQVENEENGGGEVY